MADMRRDWSYDDWDGDPRTLPLSVVRKLRRDPAYARLVFGRGPEAVVEAFEAGLSIGYLAAQQAAAEAAAALAARLPRPPSP